jgi:hypothetical protein
VFKESTLNGQERDASLYLPKWTAARFSLDVSGPKGFDGKKNPAVRGTTILPAAKGRLMPKLEYFIVCESALIDASTNRVSLFNVLEDLSPQQFPDVLPRVDAVGLWNLDDAETRAEFQATLVVKVPGHPHADFRMNLSRGYKKCRALMGVSQIPLTGPGELTFELQLNGAHQAIHTVTIHDQGVVVPWEELQSLGVP